MQKEEEEECVVIPFFLPRQFIFKAMNDKLPQLFSFIKNEVCSTGGLKTHAHTRKLFRLNDSLQH